ncbi:4'-phosphopantetheinyl transferase superfamily protein [Vibrio sp. ZSDZ65]|uniref:4'-phosphopantetheinyl transferase superfamily protein n=1 Tax=Vibrio qingdaonensis TaxID=2829491 RepID=A0A9X3HVK1_9VIBR|nr:4'-phosphopantetheinyl transferase superfamily protein [Vibrio qingdaonensis]MCW8345650.1 4'-phosphopantetheinyl transferase superfamily protein [Vibrio qingdaonensis]
MALKAVQQVDLWVCPLVDLNQKTNRLNKLQSWLSDDELSKVSRYRQPHAQLTALYVRCILRAILSRYSPIQPQQWAFEYGKKGKPRLSTLQREQTGLNFNLSHSKDYLLIALLKSDDESMMLGADIEHARENTDIHSIMNHYFSSQEIDDLKALNRSEQRGRFFDLWALKESYIKATGQGLATSLKSFAFDFSSSVANAHPLTPACVGGYATNVNILKDIGIHFIKTPLEENTTVTMNNHHLSCWQSFLGYLNRDYRFAVTVGGCDKPIVLKLQTFSQLSLPNFE